MRKIKRAPILVITLIFSSMTIGFLGFFVGVSAKPTAIDCDPLDLGYKIRDGNYGLETNLDVMPEGAGLLKTSQSTYFVEGETAYFLSLDNYLGYYFLDVFQLRAVGTTAEIWVQVDRSFPEGDPRNDPYYQDDEGRYYYPEITDAQVDYLLEEFETQIIPTDTSVFGQPDFHNGSNAALPAMLGLPQDYYYQEDGRNIILVSNIADENYYYYTYPYYVAGFYSPSIEFYFDRNVISIDSHQWYRRVGDEGDTWDSEVLGITYPPIDRPNLYESTIAHEYQHLIHDDYNPTDPSWMNEACSMYAEPLNGYQIDYGAIETFLYSPDNSLTEWGDQGDINILADYGHAFLWSVYLSDHYGGSDFLGRFVQAGIPGIEGINAALDYFHYPQDFEDVFHDWRIANLIHSDYPGHGRYNYKSLDISPYDTFVNDADDNQYGTDFGNTFTILGYDTGFSKLATYGTDYIKFEDLSKLALFLIDGDDEASFIGWEKFDGYWYTGMGDLLTTLIAFEVDVPTTAPYLELNTDWIIEDYWDFGFVQVATDGVGDWYSEWTTLTNEYTTSIYDPQALPEIIEIIDAGGEGLTGIGSGVINFDLSDYAGQTIHLGFRYMTDWGFNYPDGGWWIYEAKVGGVDYAPMLENKYPYVPVNFMVTIIEERELPNGKLRYQVDDMWICDENNVGLDLAVISKKEIAYLLVSPIMDTGYADYKFDAYSFKWWFWL